MKTIKNLLLCALVTVSLSNTCFAQRVHTSSAGQGMVVSESSLASRIGRDVLSRGGNAVDAAVATAFGLAVTWPEAGNIGGGGFMIVRPTNGMPPVFIDYRETAPLAAKEDTFSAEDSTHNRKAVAVPGTVRGLALAHSKYGKLAWHELVLPAAKLAETGFTVTQPLADSTNAVLFYTKDKDLYAELHRVYGKPGGGRWSAGDVMKLPDLAKTLYLIAENGADGFYKGPVAELTIAEMRKGKGLIRQADLDAYEAKIRGPVLGTFNGYEIIGAAPPSSGGICIVQALNMVEALDVPKDRYSPTTVHLLGEISRRIFLERARYLGDPDFVSVPIFLSSKSYAKKLANDIDRKKATNSEELAPDIKLAAESDNTTHFSVVDKDGMAVSNTYTLEASWGSRMVVAGAGYILNNEMGDFNWIKGYTNRIGRIGTNANLIRPGKRMLSSQCPLIVTKDGNVVLVTGSPGGRTIINTVLNIVLNHTYFGMSPTEAVEAPRYHHQWMPDQLMLERLDNKPYSDVEKDLEQMGHKVTARPAQGSAHTIYYDHANRNLIGIADGRRDGRPAGLSNQRLACWDFGGIRGTKMTGATNSSPLATKWDSDINGSMVDGEEHLLIRRDAPAHPASSFAPIALVADPPEHMSASLSFDGLAFRGASRNEQIRLGFTHDKNESPTVTARVILERGEDNCLYVKGEALGDGASNIPRTKVAESNTLNEPFAIRVTLDAKGDTYTIATKPAGAMKFNKLGKGTVSKKRTGCYLRLSTIGDTSANGEYVRVDQIDLRLTTGVVTSLR